MSIFDDYRFRVVRIGADGSEKVLDEAATEEKFNRLYRHFNSLQRRGIARDVTLRYKMFKLV